MKSISCARLAFRGASYLALAFLAACSSSGKKSATKSDGGKLFAVTTEKTSFYRYGPQQGNGPDQELPRDTLMTLIRPSFGYCKVSLVNGGEGYVASEDIKPATPTLLASLNPPEPAVSSSSEPENFDMQSSEPPPPESLPDPDLPPETTVPLPDPNPTPEP